MKNTKREKLSFLIIVILFKCVIFIYTYRFKPSFVNKKEYYKIRDKFLIYLKILYNRLDLLIIINLNQNIIIKKIYIYIYL